MAYPTVSGPYGFKPIKLIGGQYYAAATTQYPIQYGYATSIFNGDLVTITRGNITLAQVTTSTSGGQVLGVFLGCSYTDPVSKQKIWSQYYPASTLAGDIVAYVADDPDVLLQAAMVTTQGGTTIGSANTAVLGLNLAGSYLAGSTTTGDSYNGILAPTTTPSTGVPFRVISLVKDSAVSVAATGSSSTTTITLTGSGLPSAIVSGAEVNYIAANGQLINTGSYVNNASGYAAGSTSITINATIAVPGSVTAIPAASTIVFTQYPEVIVKYDFGIHTYYTA